MKPPRAGVREPRRGLSLNQRLGDSLTIMRALWAVNHGMEVLSRRMQRTLGVTGPERMVVRLVGRSSDISPGDLARLLHVHPSTLTGLLRRLVQRGIIQRTVHPDDGRMAVLRLTARGRSLDVLSSGTVEAAVRRTLRTLSQQDVERTILVLESIQERLRSE